MSPVPSSYMPDQEAVEGYVKEEHSQRPSSSAVPWTSPSCGTGGSSEGAEAALKALL